MLTTVPLSVQLENLNPLAAEAVKVTEELQPTVPPPVVVPLPAGETLVLMVSVHGAAVKFATNVWSPVAVMV